jgi:hypothetical protein
MNIVSIIVAAASSFLLGGIWYSILFGSLWQKEVGLTCDQLKSHGVKPYIVTGIYSLIAAFAFYYLVMNSVSLSYNLIIGFIVGILVATSLGTNYQFAGRSTLLFLIDAGYHVARFVLYALIFWFIKV